MGTTSHRQQSTNGSACSNELLALVYHWIHVKAQDNEFSLWVRRNSLIKSYVNDFKDCFREIPFTGNIIVVRRWWKETTTLCTVAFSSIGKWTVALQALLFGLKYHNNYQPSHSGPVSSTGDVISLFLASIISCCTQLLLICYKGFGDLVVFRTHTVIMIIYISESEKVLFFATA